MLRSISYAFKDRAGCTDGHDQSRADAGSSVRRGSGPAEDAFALARSFDPGAMQVVQSGKDKEDLLGRPATAHNLRLL